MEIFDRYIEEIKSNKFNCNTVNDDLITFINNRDESGRTLLHWAAFLGNNAALIHFLHNGANVLLASEKDENFQAIHFSVVNNHTDCMTTLFDYGVSLETCDMFRRTPLCIAASYGRVVATVFLLSKQSNIEHCDLNGNNALHFAALNGNCDLCQILIYAGIDVRSTNDFGETAIHLASQRGSKRLLKSLLLGQPQLLHQPDGRGITPIGHAKAHRNSVGLAILNREQKNHSRKWSCHWKKTDLLYGSGRSNFSLIFLVVMVFFFAIPIYITNIVRLTYSDWPFFNWLLIIDGSIFTMSLFAVNSIGPGYLPRYTKQYDDTLKTVAQRKLGESDIMCIFSRLCHTCRTVKPVRASHCNVCRRCVREKDHHCHYVHNCIGFRNRQYFLCFLVSTWFGIILTIVFAIVIRCQYDYRFAIYEYVGLGVTLFFFVFINMVMVGVVLGVLRNITTNESTKWNKYGYEYLRNEFGQYANPFDRGIVANILAFFRIIIEFQKRKSDTIHL